MCRCLAARPKCNSSPTATKQRSCLSSYIDAIQVSIYADYSLFRDRSSTIFFRGNGIRSQPSSKSRHFREFAERLGKDLSWASGARIEYGTITGTNGERGTSQATVPKHGISTIQSGGRFTVTSIV